MGKFGSAGDWDKLKTKRVKWQSLAITPSCPNVDSLEVVEQKNLKESEEFFSVFREFC